jgi:curved DNA-binding protein CbpA
MSGDYYEVLQVNPTAEPDTIHRVYRLLAQRFHPDNRETGNASRFREISEAYHVLSNPETRAQYDAVHHERQQERWRLVSNGQESENNFEIEQNQRLTVLEVLYTQRRVDSSATGMFLLEIERLTGEPREHLEFTIWYLSQKDLVQRSDGSRFMITAQGVDYLEENYRTVSRQRRLAAPERNPVSA